MHKSLYLLFIIIFSFSIQAKEITLGPDQSYLFKGINISLINVGQRGSIVLQIGNEKPQTTSTSLEAEGIIVELVNSLYDLQKENRYATLLITQIAECLVNKDCEDPNPCSRDLCTLKRCYHIEEKGCIYKDKCLEYKEEIAINQKRFYCAENNELHEMPFEQIIPTTLTTKEIEKSYTKFYLIGIIFLFLILIIIFLLRKIYPR